MGARASDVLRAAIRLGASGFVLVHNHPSGDPTPSAEDVVFTQHTLRAALAVGVPLLDHVVVAGRLYASVIASGDVGSTAEASSEAARG
jgi:DNA repair protein RadC